MAGHSHAKNVMHRKAPQGAKKAQAFGELIRKETGLWAPIIKSHEIEAQ